MATRSASQPGRATRWLLCRAGVHACGLPVESVALAMRRPVLDRWSGADMVVLGVATVRGEAVPVISLGRVLGDGGDAEDASSESHMLVLRLPRRLVGLCVDRVLGVHTLGSEAPADLPPLLRGAHAEHVTHLARLDGELLLLLEAGRLLPRDFGVDVGGGTA